MEGGKGAKGQLVAIVVKGSWVCEDSESTEPALCVARV
jgi:hypothetical protein